MSVLRNVHNTPGWLAVFNICGWDKLSYKSNALNSLEFCSCWVCLESFWYAAGDFIDEVCACNKEQQKNSCKLIIHQLYIGQFQKQYKVFKIKNVQLVFYSNPVNTCSSADFSFSLYLCAIYLLYTDSYSNRLWE